MFSTSGISVWCCVSVGLCLVHLTDLVLKGSFNLCTRLSLSLSSCWCVNVALAVPHLCAGFMKPSSLYTVVQSEYDNIASLFFCRFIIPAVIGKRTEWKDTEPPQLSLSHPTGHVTLMNDIIKQWCVPFRIKGVISWEIMPNHLKKDHLLKLSSKHDSSSNFWHQKTK